MNPEISVIIPALNEEKYIRHVLEGLKKQTFRDFEIIVVDGGSRDNTREIAGKMAKVILERKKGPGVARNAGEKVSRAKLLLFLDADTQPSKDLLMSYVEIFKDKSTIAATGPIMPLENADNAVAMGYRVVSVFFVKLSILFGRPSIVGSNFAVRRTAFEKVNGFNPKMITYEDWDLSMRLKKYGRIRFIEDAVVYTSIRRISKWGILGFVKYFIGNAVRYYLFNEPKKDYGQIR